MNASNIPSGVTLGVQCYAKGWAGHAQAACRERHESLEQWHAEYPTLTVYPVINRARPDAPFVTYAWRDDRYWTTPEDAFDAIHELVLADVRLVEAAS